MNVQGLLAQLLNGVVFGLLLFLMAAGLSLIFGLMDVINLAHGSFYLLGGYVGLSIVRATGRFWLALVVAPVVVGLVGLAVEAGVLRRLYRRGHLDQVLFTFGVALVAADLMRWNWGAYVEDVSPPAALSGSVVILGNEFPTYRLAIIVLGLVVAGLLWLLLERTRVGAIVRAGVDDGEMVAALGIDVQRVVAGVFALGTALAALAGIVAAPILNLYPGLDFEILILALVVVVVGGLGTLRGAFWAALLIGMAETIGKAFLPRFSLFVIFVIMAIVLLVRPTGLFGQREGA